MSRSLVSKHILSSLRNNVTHLNSGTNVARKYSSTGSKGQLMQRIAGKVAVISASTDGIGLSIAQRLASEGAKVVVSSRNPENVERAVQQLKCDGYPEVLGVKCHVGNADDRERLFDEAVKRFGGVDIFVASAGVNPCQQMPVFETSESEWDKIFDVNVKAAFLMAKRARQLMLQRGGGNIVFVSSVAAFFQFPALGAYTVSKTALLALTKTAALQCARENIRVNCVAPGVIPTNFTKSIYENKDDMDYLMSRIPMKCLGKSEQISGIVAFLVSEDASYMTGETIIAAGGMHTRM